MVSFPYYSHTTPITIPRDMGMVWEAYHKGVPLMGVPGFSLEKLPGPNRKGLSSKHNFSGVNSLLNFGGVRIPFSGPPLPILWMVMVGASCF